MYGLFSEYVNINPENKIRKFKVLKSFEINDWCVYEGDVILLVGNIWRTSYGHYLAHISYYPIEVLFNNYCIEEILPDEKPISSEKHTNIEDDIYSKKYNIYEILTLIPNIPKDSRIECSLDNHVWDIAEEENTLIIWDSEVKRYNSINIEDIYSLKQILEATYTLVKPVEEVGEKWTPINTRLELFIKIREGKKIKEYTITEKYTAEATIYSICGDSIPEGIWNIFGKFGNTNYFVEYLEDN